MLSHLKSYLFGGTNDVVYDELQDGATTIANNPTADDDWVLVDCQEVVGDLVEDDENSPSTSPSAFDESWIVTKDLALKAVIASRGNKSRRNSRQPKGTKPRRWKGRNIANGSCVEGPVKAKLGKASLDDVESTSSSIAVIPSPVPLTRPAATTAAASAILAASNDAKQLAAISSARTAQLRSGKNLMSRKGMMRGNKSVAAAKQTAKRSNLMGSRPCGSNNNRKTHKN